MTGSNKKREKQRILAKRPQSGFAPRVIAVTLMILVVFLGWTFYGLLANERQMLIKMRTDMLREQVNIALSVCEQFNQKVESLSLTEEDAVEHATRVIRDLRYGDTRTGYFFILDTAENMVLHPQRPDLEGTSVRELTDGNGTAFIEELTRGSLTTPTEVISYQWRWEDGATDVDTRIAVVGTFEPWNWLVVTDLAKRDMYKGINAGLIRQAGILLMLTLVLAGVLSTTLKHLVLQGVDTLIATARHLARGDLSHRVKTSPADELGELARSINQMAEGLQAHSEQLRLTQRTAMFALAKLAEARDNETGGHLLRVREYATTLAHSLRVFPGWQEIIDKNFIADLYDASLLHDIGKVAVPDYVLLKPDTLDDGERAIMMSHTLVGANTIRAARQLMKAESSFLTMAEQIARSHHERWDGNGYVECLAGESIPPAARIFCVADVYDALTSERPYKKAYTHAQAIEMMREDVGKHYDPVVFEAFLGVSAKFDDIRAEFAD